MEANKNRNGEIDYNGTINLFTDYLGKENPRFNKEKFLECCLVD